MTAQLFNILSALTFVLLLIFGLALLVRRYAPALTRTAVPMRVLASLPLGGKERVILIQAGAAYLVLGVSPGRVQTLHQLDKAALEQYIETGNPAVSSNSSVLMPANGAAAGFASLLQNIMGKS